MLRQQIGELLHKDEQPIVMQPARFIETESELTDYRFSDADERAGEDVASDREAALRPAETDEAWERRIVELLDGGSYYGWRGCRALALRKALDLPTTHLLVTDERVMVVDMNHVDDPAIEWEHERARLRKVWKQSRFLEPGRVIMVLDDGSVLAVHVGAIGGKPAKLVVQACQHC